MKPFNLKLEVIFTYEIEVDSHDTADEVRMNITDIMGDSPQEPTEIWYDEKNAIITAVDVCKYCRERANPNLAKFGLKVCTAHYDNPTDCPHDNLVETGENEPPTCPDCGDEIAGEPEIYLVADNSG